MKIAFYFAPDRAWTWSDFRARTVGLSGTDAQVLRVADKLSYRDGVEVLVFQVAPTSAHDRIHAERVGDVHDVVARARAYDVDVLVFNVRGDEATETLIAACDAAGQPSVAWEQNGPDDRMADLLAASKAVRRVVTVSRSQADLARHHPVFGKIAVAPNSVEPLYFSSVGARRAPGRVVYVGALTPAKGFHLLASVWPRVRARVPYANLRVIGSALLYDDHAQLGSLGVAEASFEKLLRSHLGETREECAQNGVTFLGLLPPERIREELRQATVGVVNPHTLGSTETFCVSAAEMQACGVPVIGGRALGLRETVQHGRTGLLARSQRELERYLGTLLEHPERARDLGVRAERFAASAFAPGRVEDVWVRLFQEVIAGDQCEPVPLAMQRATPRVLLRESLRQARSLPLVGAHIPSLEVVRKTLRSLQGAR
jgi:glycosyltransferase involved in cell wall biosynthesis